MAASGVGWDGSVMGVYWGLMSLEDDGGVAYTRQRWPRRNRPMALTTHPTAEMKNVVLKHLGP